MTIDDFCILLESHDHQYGWKLNKRGNIRWRGVEHADMCPLAFVTSMELGVECGNISFIEYGLFPKRMWEEVMSSADNSHRSNPKTRQKLLKATGLA